VLYSLDANVDIVQSIMNCKADVRRAIKIVRYCCTIIVVQRSCPTNHVTHT